MSMPRPHTRLRDRKCDPDHCQASSRHDTRQLQLWWWCLAAVIQANHWKRLFQCHKVAGWSRDNFQHGHGRLGWQGSKLIRSRSGSASSVSRSGLWWPDAKIMTNPALISMKASLTRMTPLLAKVAVLSRSPSCLLNQRASGQWERNGRFSYGNLTPCGNTLWVRVKRHVIHHLDTWFYVQKMCGRLLQEFLVHTWRGW